MHFQTHHQLLAKRINGWIRDLCETLFEVVVQQMGPIRQNRQRNVVSHAIGRLLAKASHVLDHQIEVFSCEAHCSLQTQQIEFSDAALLNPRLRWYRRAVLTQPVGVRKTLGSIFFDSPVIEELTGL